MFLWSVQCSRPRTLVWGRNTHRIKRNNWKVGREAWQDLTNMCDKLNIILGKKKGWKMDRKIQTAILSVEDFCGGAFAASQANKWRSVFKEISGPLIKMTAPPRERSFERSAGFVHRRCFDAHSIREAGQWFLRLSPWPPLSNCYASIMPQLVFATFKATNPPLSLQQVYGLSVSPAWQNPIAVSTGWLSFIYFCLSWFAVLPFCQAFRQWPKKFLKWKKNFPNEHDRHGMPVFYLPAQGCLRRRGRGQGSRSRWHLWPGTMAVDAGHMLHPQRPLAPFLPRWACARTGRLEHAGI